MRLGNSEPISGTDITRIKIISKALSSVSDTAMQLVAVLVAVAICTDAMRLLLITCDVAQRVA